MRILRSGRNGHASVADDEDEMTWFEHDGDGALYLLASRDIPPGRDDLSDLDVFLAALKEAAVASPRPSPELAVLLAEGLSPAAPAATPSSCPGDGRPKRRKRIVLETALAKLASLGLAAKASVAGATLLAATTGAGVAGALPDPAQEAAADAVSTVSPFEVPRPDDAAVPADAGAPDDVDVPAAGDPAANDHGQKVAETARTTDAEGCERGQQIAQVAGGDPDGCVHAGGDARPETPADHGLETAAEQAGDEAQPGLTTAGEAVRDGRNTADEAVQERRGAAGDAGPDAQQQPEDASGASGDGLSTVDEAVGGARPSGDAAADADQRGGDAADTPADDAAASRP